MKSVKSVVFKLNQRFEIGDEFCNHEGLAFHFVVLVGDEAIDFGTQVSGELAEVLFGHHHLRVLLQHRSRIGT